jgi:two-component system sensor histidine kinase/response regulator
MDNPSGQNLKPEILVPRIGDYLIERGMITIVQLQQALQYQSSLRKTTPNVPLIGEILVDMGFISHDDLDKAITEHVLQLRAALLENNRRLDQRVNERTAELEKAMAKLSELNQLKANFIANISHELRTPMTHIKGYLELILGGDTGDIPEKQRGAMLTIQRATNRLERLIEDLILFASADRDEMEVDLVPVDLRSLCAEKVEQAQSKATSQNLLLTLQTGESYSKVLADREKIGWVIAQLLDNAIKFTPPGGKIFAYLSQDKTTVTLSIQDTGIGIPAHRIDELFEPFHQLDSSSTRRYGGTGLGLSLAFRIIEAHDSAIDIMSEIGEGSIFSFTLNKVNPDQ